MKDDFVLTFKVRGVTEKQQTEIVMKTRKIVNSIRPGRIVIGIEKKG